MFVHHLANDTDADDMSANIDDNICKIQRFEKPSNPASAKACTVKVLVNDVMKMLFATLTLDVITGTSKKV